MELRHLRYFVTVARTLNFSRAAEQLHIAQPPLSRQIQQLEAELGVQLLERTSRQMKLTAAGTFFLAQAQQLLARIDEVQAATRRIGNGSRRWMGIGFVPSVLYGFLPNTLRDFCALQPNLDVSLSELTSLQQAEALMAGRIDVGFGRLAIQREGLDNILLCEEALIVAMASNSALSAASALSLEQIAEHTLVLYPASPRPSFADQVLHQFSIRGIEQPKNIETNGLQTAIGLTAAGLGLCIVPESVRRLNRDDISYRAITDVGVTTPLVMTVRRGDQSPHLLEFKRMIEHTLTSVD